jgi:hypothetical protein
MFKKALAALAVAVALSLLAAIALGATPKTGKYAGTTATTKKKITMKVKSATEGTVHYCNYKMGTKISKKGKFDAKHVGPGGTYVEVKGKFVSSTQANGKVAIDYLCGAQGESFTLNHKK